MPALMGFVALAVDVGHMYSVVGETQNAVDAAAAAGAAALASKSDVDARVHTYLNQNYLTQGFASNLETIEVGRWDRETRTFTAGAENANAVRVAVTRQDGPLYFAPALGVNTFSVPREAIAMANPPGDCRVWGIGGVVIEGGSNTDSYDSTVAAYDPLDAGSQGDVCSCQDVTLEGRPTIVNGDIFYGDGYLYTTNGSAHATETVAELDACLNAPLDFGDAATVNDNGTIGLSDDGRDPVTSIDGGVDFLLDGTDQIALDPGTYYFNTFTLTGNSTLTITGPTTIYITDAFTVDGSGIANATGIPANLSIVSAADIELAGNMSMHATVFAPNSNVTIEGGSDLYGSVIAGFLTLGGGSNIHVDESLPFSSVDATPPVLVK